MNMKISSIDVIPISYPLKEEAFDATAKWSEFNCVLVRVITSNGLIGIGEISPLHGREMPIFEAIIKKKLEGQIVGENPLDREKLWIKMIGKGSSAFALSTKGAITSAVSAIDMALWDIVGQLLDTPLYNLLGGKYRDKVKLYVSFMGEVTVEKLKEFIRQGFKSVKVKVGFDVEKDLEKIKEIRECIGYDFDLMTDANQGYSLSQAIMFSKRGRDYNIYWLEEPINIYNLKALRILANKSEIPIAIGENYYTKSEFIEVVTNCIVDVIQPDLNHVGGITEIRKVASLAECYDVMFAPHLHSVVGLAAGLHMLTATPNGLIAEYVVYGRKWEFRDRILRNCITIEDGWARVINKRGIGVEIDESYVEQYKYRG